MTTFDQKFSELVKVTQSEQQQLQHETDINEYILEIEESVKSQDLFQDNNAIAKKYLTNRIKSRHFLSNIAYVGIIKEDHYNRNFVFDVYLLLTKNLNTFFLNRKLADKTKHEMIYMLWKECMPAKFYKHICKIFSL